MINIENKLPVIIFLIVFNVLSYFAGHKDGQNDNYFLGTVYLSIILLMGLGAYVYHSYLGYLK